MGMMAERSVEDIVKAAERLLRDLDYNVTCLVDYEAGVWKLAFRAEKEVGNEKIEFSFDNERQDLTELLSLFRWWYKCVWGFDLNEVLEDGLAMGEDDDDG
jgi:hypothetical protein